MGSSTDTKPRLRPSAARRVPPRRRGETAGGTSDLLPGLGLVFAGSLDAIAVHHAGRHVLVNPAFARLFGYDGPDEPVGKPILDIIAPEERERVAAAVARRATGEPSVYITRGLRRDGTRFDLEIHGSTFFVDGLVHVLAILRDVSERMETLRRLQEDQERFRTLFEASPDPAWLIEGTAFIDCNAAAVAILGYPDKQSLLVHPSRLSPEVQPCGESSHGKAERMMRLARERGIHRFEWAHRRADGSDFPAEVTLSSMQLQGREVIYCVWRDISRRKHAEDALVASEQRFRDFTFTSADWIWETDRAGHFTYVAGNVERIIGYTPDELLGRAPFDLMAPEDGPRLRAAVQELARTHRPFSDMRSANIRKDGTVQHASISGMPILDGSGRLIGYRGVCRDISALQERDERISKLAFHDALTDLPNRILLEDRVTQALLAGRRNRTRTALLFLDLDRFKMVNDSLGHDVGDELLKVMAGRMQSILRRSDTLSRLGGDEFAVLLPEIDGMEEAVRVGEKIIAALSQPVSLHGHEFTVGVSIGAAIAPDDGDAFHLLLKNADTAMYRAKEEGRSTLRFFDSSMNARVIGNLTLEARLRRAIDNGELELHYQPKIELPSGRVAGAEGLVRWRLDGRMVSPAEFIPLAEETGLIVPLGDLVLTKALEDARAWRAAGVAPPRVAVNLSARQFGDRGLVDRILRTVADHGAAPAELEFELTESLMMTDLDRALAALERLSGEGFAIALDDFGTGYSSLSHLKRLPIHCVKIDRSFVSDIGTDGRDESLVDAILAIGRSLGLEVVAEGVETAGQVAFLRDRGCSLFQGYHFSKPLPPAEFGRFAAQRP